MKKLIAIALAGVLTLAMTACGAQNSAADTTAATTAAATAATETTAETTEAAKLSGTVTLAGSTSMQKLCEAMIESFEQVYPDITVTAEYTGSGAGLEALAGGKTDIGNASRSLKDGEKQSGAVENIVAIDGIAVITHKDSVVSDLTAQQLTDIYTGKITNWKDLGGADEAIVVLGREAGSGTRGAFEELLKIEDQCAYAQELDSTGGVLAKVAATPGSIGYVSLDVVDDTVKALSLDGVAPTEENIVAGSYKLSRPFVMATLGTIEEQNDLVKTWFHYVQSDEGQAVIKAMGLILPQ
ncbi:phosphate ABC transporter substrate-binding protein [Pseudoflavonifractor sp. MSJ-30]|uniref:phosphate ABC transporter substrate-binding protein n=1 Tax=Pseudoflavonifractor sp. MSJ-30 TaxID=2841525 RepID=UPI001C0F921D|nr:phosphate ABC transporter substrate-binding protein [Pseudoflavonifractor sp. MSJ-30]MBU5452394.1 phosphate ABC transporter substrate-binding protein [Pseudoflavonifractor sp. MSJ-30]